MTHLSQLYHQPLSLLTDLYQLTMAYGYWRLGTAGRRAVFHLSFRTAPFKGHFAVACGLESVIEYLAGFRFDASDVEYLSTLKGNDGNALFAPEFLHFLAGLRLSCDVDAVPEGTVVFPHEPLLRVTGPLLEAQLLETVLLNLLNFPTLVATKAARICQATQGEPVLEFGLRRAQGIDGALTASRSAFVGGCAATSNVLAGKIFGIPVRGTHAHSWIMSFADEIEAFEAYAGAMPNNCVFLVDTYDTLQGVRHAVQVGRRLRTLGHELVGIRLDSGDLAYLSEEARHILDEGGFPKAAIFASNDLDEHIIQSLKQQGAKIGVWAVGTRLATAYDQPALGGVYKLAALARDDGTWEHKIKLSEQRAKVSVPGLVQTRRFRRDGQFMADAIYDEILGISLPTEIIDPSEPTRSRRIEPGTSYEDLLVPIFRGGRRVYEIPPLVEVQRRTSEQLAGLHPSVTRFLNPHSYPAGFEKRLYDLRADLIQQARSRNR